MKNRKITVVTRFMCYSARLYMMLIKLKDPQTLLAEPIIYFISEETPK